MMTVDLASATSDKLVRLRALVRGWERVVIAYSGGCDSAFLLAIATQELGAGAIGLTAVGASLAPGELDNARAVAGVIGATHVEVESREIEDARYAANPVNRCYYCKTELYDLARAEASRRNISIVASGTNADELGDYRPGLKAAAEHTVSQPLADVGLTKQEIRELSRRMGLPTHDKPQTPCLASRLPYGTAVTRERLSQVDRAEQVLRDEGFRIFRVRHHDTLARIEAAADELPRLLDPDVRARVQRGVIAAGYAFCVVDLEPFRSGRLNEAAGLVPLKGAAGRV